jgi:hypothetical protein
VSGPAEGEDAGNGVGRKKRDSYGCGRDVSALRLVYDKIQRTSKALPKQGVHMVQTTCVREMKLSLVKCRAVS